MLRAADHFADCVVGEKSTIASLVARFWDVQEGAVRIGGVDTVIGAKGIYVSGGERQRISIARAFLKDAPIILLDEVMASLDVDNETLIQSSLSKLIQNKTVDHCAPHENGGKRRPDRGAEGRPDRRARQSEGTDRERWNLCSYVQAADRRAEVDNGVK